MKPHCAVAAAVLAVGCGGDVEQLPPRGQILLFVDTDAPLPPAPGTLASAGDPPWLFDRLRFEVRRGAQALPGVIALAERDFSVHRGLFSSGPVSIGIVPQPHDPELLVRVQLFRGDRMREGEPLPDAVMQSTASLPVVEPEGIQKIFVFLHTDDTGKPQGVPRPLAPSRNIPAASRVGSWQGARLVPCAGEPRPEEACVPGGAFWMGDPALRGNPEMLDTDDEHLVVVSPFYLDRTEVSVRDFREALPDLEAAGAVLPHEWDGNANAATIEDYSTFTRAPHPNDPGDAHAALPVNTVPWATARAYCQRLGKDLPSEAMLEFVSSGRGLENEYVWGDDPPSCDAAVFGRAGLGPYAGFDGECRPPYGIGGPLPPGSGGRDRVALGAASVVDLAGNLSEWTLDWTWPQDAGAWASRGLRIDPVATDEPPPGPNGEPPERAVRGGSWRGRFIEMRAGARTGRPPDEDNRSVGFRCVRRP